MAGSSRGKREVFTFLNGEKINYLSIYDNGLKTYPGAFHIKTDRDARLFFPKMYKNKLQKQSEYEMAVGDGIILGLYGQETSSEIVRLGFKMLSGISVRKFAYDISIMKICCLSLGGGYYWRDYAVGGNGGDRFEFDKSDKGVTITTLEVWEGETSLLGLRVGYSDNTFSKLAGSDRGKHQKLELQRREKITYLSIYGNGDRRTYAGAIHIKTNKQEFFPKNV